MVDSCTPLVRRAIATTSAFALVTLVWPIAGCATVQGRACVFATYECGRRAFASDKVEDIVENRAGVEVVCAGSLAYIVSVDGGVVVIDAGLDETGAALLAAIGTRHVLAVLLTHGHLDHRAAAHLIDAQVYVGEADMPLMRGGGRARSLGASVNQALGVPPPPARLEPVKDGRVVEEGGHRFVAISLPGHTPGSTAWLVDGLLFTGDALQAIKSDELYVGPASFSDDVRVEHRWLRKLRDVAFTEILDGHYGITTDAHARIWPMILRDHGDDDDIYRQPWPRAVRCAAELAASPK